MHYSDKKPDCKLPKTQAGKPVSGDKLQAAVEKAKQSKKQ